MTPEQKVRRGQMARDQLQSDVFNQFYRDEYERLTKRLSVAEPYSAEVHQLQAELKAMQDMARTFISWYEQGQLVVENANKEVEDGRRSTAASGT